MTVVERLARRLFRAHYEAGRAIPPSWALLDRFDQERWLFSARAALAELRAPSDRMIEEGFQHTGDPCWPENVKLAWQAMIDAALQEERR